MTANNSDLQVRMYDSIGHSLAWPLSLDALVELGNSGLLDQPAIPISPNDACLTCEDADGVVLGFLAYRYDEAKANWFILLAYVLPMYRKRGIHTLLFSALVERAKARGDIIAIESGTHIKNYAAQAAFERQGRIATYLCYRFQVQERLSGKSHLDGMGEVLL